MGTIALGNDEDNTRFPPLCSLLCPMKSSSMHIMFTIFATYFVEYSPANEDIPIFKNGHRAHYDINVMSWGQVFCHMQLIQWHKNVFLEADLKLFFHTRIK